MMTSKIVIAQPAARWRPANDNQQPDDDDQQVIAVQEISPRNHLLVENIGLDLEGRQLCRPRSAVLHQHRHGDAAERPDVRQQPWRAAQLSGVSRGGGERVLRCRRMGRCKTQAVRTRRPVQLPVVLLRRHKPWRPAAAAAAAGAGEFLGDRLDFLGDACVVRHFS